MNFESSSAWSFGKTTKGKIKLSNKNIGKMDKTDILTNPGPGSYQPSIMSNKAPNWK